MNGNGWDWCIYAYHTCMVRTILEGFAIPSYILLWNHFSLNEKNGH